MVNRQDLERRRRDWERQEQLRRERRGPQGFTKEDWSKVRRPSRPVQNPLEDQDDYSMPYREDWEHEGDWYRVPERERWMDYGRVYEQRFEDRQPGWQQGAGRSRWEGPWHGRYEERDFQSQEDERRWGMRGRSRQDWNDYETEYGRGVYEQRRDRPEGRRRSLNPYNRGFFRRDEAAHPDYLERYDEARFGNEWETGDEYEGDIAYSYTEFWLTPGPFTGIGPKGYQRSDERIFEDICYRMSVNGQIDPSEVDVKVENGEVTLEGKVQDRFSKRLAEDIAESVSGVSDVHNRIRVGRREDQSWLGTREGAQSQTGARAEDMDEE